jgi:hypothetical protein
MTDADEIDTRRAKVIYEAPFMRAGQKIVFEWDSLTLDTKEPMFDLARAIRLSDEAAGYELCKRVEHRGAIE